ncbi:unnamed protein product [Brachionus calyciflorus]|uniref:Major facilitator superfamily (MFS) profile domain-containing protein n=1 Tax=Brachionus calyciflorus TaxID=104777 RepID=A0A814H567_9BILA|nr:unnamed protein product [Brachionus calyciflorus]
MSLSDEITSKNSNYSSINDESMKEKKISFRETYQNYITAFIICSLNLLNVTDRYVVSSVLIDVQHYFQVDKSTAGLLQTAFLLCYMAFSPLNGYLGDRINRKYLLVFSLVLWISSTLLGSYVPADKFYLFVLSRCLFGVATASFETIAVPIIGDRFFNDQKQRNRVIILFCMGPPLGTGLSYLIGILSKDLEPDDWRFSMRITPFALLLILISILTGYFEPKRGKDLKITNNDSNSSSFSQDLKILIKNKTFILLSLCWITGIGALSGFSWWSPTLIDYSLRYHQLPYDLDNLKKAYSLIQSLSGVVGLLIPYQLSIYFKKKSYEDIDCFFISLGFFSSSFFMFLYLASIKISAYLTICIYMLMLIFFNFCWVLETNIFLDIVQPRLRSTANSMMIFFLHLFGDSSSPYWIGLIADKCLDLHTKNTVLSSLYCAQLSNYPLVFVFFISGSFALFTTLSFKKDKQIASNLTN